MALLKQVNLAHLPSREIWYRQTPVKEYPARLLSLRREKVDDQYGREYETVVADIICESAAFSGVGYAVNDVPYGRNKDKHWWFHEWSPEVEHCMKELGIEFTEEERQHCYHPTTLKTLMEAGIEKAEDDNRAKSNTSGSASSDVAKTGNSKAAAKG